MELNGAKVPIVLQTIFLCVPFWVEWFRFKDLHLHVPYLSQIMSMESLATPY